MRTNEQTYIGDGLYASYDGLMFELSAERDNGRHYVFLEPQVVDAFLRFVEQKWNVTITVKEKQ